MPGTILIIEDEPVLGQNLARFLKRRHHAAILLRSGSDLEATLARHEPDVVLLDYELPDCNGIDLLARIHAQEPDCRVIMMTGKGSIDIAVSAMKTGATDFIAKPLVLEDLGETIERILEEKQKSSTLDYLQRREASQSGVAMIRGESPAIQAVRDRIGRYLAAELEMRDGIGPAVLITGETGTGKELVARAFHFDGIRRDGPFVEINCASIPSELLESELFGYEKGAFTGAASRKTGLVESAQGGTLFLDEIGDMSLELQAKILTLLENRTMRRVGGVLEKPVDVRIVAATNQDLQARVSEGLFRRDLLYRLNVIHIELPSLKARGDDISVLANHFLREIGANYGKPGLTLQDDVRQKILKYPWPGNVRELRNTMEHAVLLSSNAVSAAALSLSDPREAIDESPAPACQDNGSSDIHSLNLESIEREVIMRALHSAGQNVTGAARLLGLSRDTLRYRLKKHGINAV